MYNDVYEMILDALSLPATSWHPASSIGIEIFSAKGNLSLSRREFGGILVQVRGINGHVYLEEILESSDNPVIADRFKNILEKFDDERELRSILESILEQN